MRDDRREHQRLKLSKPILASMGSNNALILDVGLAGAFLEHYGSVRIGERFPLTFRWQGADVEFLCEVTRSTVVRDPGGDGKSLVSHTGVRFAEAFGDARVRLQDLITTFVTNILTAQKANASGQLGESAGATVLARMGDARRMRSRGFIAYRYLDGQWTHEPTTLQKQPADGFTVGEHEDPEDVAILCDTYASADEEARQLIRVVAELSLRRER
ncbi:MAG: hypothetical protein M3Q69_04065 [Acidobacteriota bacterium]|nr:hypothetical protein [Acidobacteriota bacterium]